MNNHRKTVCTLAGILAGIIIVHPYVMLVNRLTGPGPLTSQPQSFGDVGFPGIIAPNMLPMTIAFAFFGGICGLLLGLLIERNRRVLHFRYQAQLHTNLTAALHQLLDVVSHYILNGSMVISSHARRLEKKTAREDLPHLAAIIKQAEHNEAVLKLLKESDFLQQIDPTDATYEKLIELNRKIEAQLKHSPGEV